MAWWSLYRWFAHWRKTPYSDMAYYYSEYVLKTPEQREKDKAERQRKGEEALRRLSAIVSASDRGSNGAFSRGDERISRFDEIKFF